MSNSPSTKHKAVAWLRLVLAVSSVVFFLLGISFGIKQEFSSGAFYLILSFTISEWIKIGKPVVINLFTDVGPIGGNKSVKGNPNNGYI